MVRARGMEKQLFSQELIPQQIASTLPSGYKLRPLQSGDYERGVLQVLEVLTTVGNISKEKYLGMEHFSSCSPVSAILIYLFLVGFMFCVGLIGERFEWLLKRNDSYFTIVIENDNDKIVAVGSLLVEAKLYSPTSPPPLTVSLPPLL
jgi:glucosamine-phosphate N-acetyltransferase